MTECNGCATFSLVVGYTDMIEIVEKDVDSEARIYEIGYHIVPTIPEEKLVGEVGAIKDILAKEKAAVIAEDFPKRRELAYTIKKSIAGKYQKFDTAYFGWVKFEVVPEGIHRIKDGFEKNANILRFILVETVRESTLLASQKIFVRRPEGEKHEKKEIPMVSGDAPIKSPISEAELDKTIDELVVE